MRQRSVTLPVLFLIAGTRVALGFGLGLLLAERLNRQQRQAAGWALVAVGALTTIPLATQVFFGGVAPEGHGAERSIETQAVLT